MWYDVGGPLEGGFVGYILGKERKEVDVLENITKTGMVRHDD